MIKASATGGHGGAAQPLHGASEDKEERARGDAASDAGGGERHDAAQEHPLVAEQVRQPSRQQQEATEGQQVGIENSGQRGFGETQSAWMDGNATFTMLESRTIIRSPRHSTYSAGRRACLSFIVLLPGACQPRHDQA